MKTPINTLLIVLCCVVAILTGCKIDSVDTNLIGNKNCSPPCWNNITPGQTSKDNAILAMHQLNREKGGELSINDYGISWREKILKGVYTIELQDNFVKLIRFPTNGTSLEKVINLFGEPNYYAAGFGREGEHFILIYYPNKGLAFIVDLEDEKVITKDASVTYSYFLPSTDIRNEIGIIHGEKWIDKFMTELHEWKGYGDVIP